MIHGMTIYTWHGDEASYDEVSWMPEAIAESDARGLAFLKLNLDSKATRVQIELGDRVVDLSKTSAGGLQLFGYPLAA